MGKIAIETSEYTTMSHLIDRITDVTAKISINHKSQVDLINKLHPVNLENPDDTMPLPEASEVSTCQIGLINNSLFHLERIAIQMASLTEELGRII